MKIIRRLVIVFPLVVALILGTGVLFALLGRVQRVVEAEGEIRVARYEVVRPRVSGLVIDGRVEPGESVRRGQVVLELRDHGFETELAAAGQALAEARSRVEKLRLQLRLEQELIQPLEVERKRAAVAEAGLEAQLQASRTAEAELELDAARERHRRDRQLAEAGLISQQQLRERHQQELAAEQRLVQARLLEQRARRSGPNLGTELELLRGEQSRERTRIEAEIDELEGRIASGTAHLERLHLQQGWHAVRAGMDGVLVGAPSHELLGRRLEAGQEVATIVDTASIRFWTRVPEGALVQVRSGQAAHVEISGLPKDRFRLFSGEVEKILPEPETEIAASEPLYPVQIRLAEPWIPLEEGRFYLRSGMRGTAKIAYRRNVPLLRALYEFLTNEPQLPETPAPETVARR